VDSNVRGGENVNIYMAAVYSNSYMPGMNRYVKLNDRERDAVVNVPHILESWHYVGKQSFVDHMRNNKAQIFLDSGAFSAYTLGVKLSVEEYCDYIYRNWDIIRGDGRSMMASVLDGIGDPEETWRNQHEMERIFKEKHRVDWKPLPCFHAGEPEHFLESYVKNYEYITLGGMVGSSTQSLAVWLDRMWENYLTDGSGRPRCKVHGFGITSRPLMERYPWASCDSSSWIQSAAFGAIETPAWGPMTVSEKSPSRFTAGQHACNLTPIEQDVVFRMLEEQGFTYERLSTVYESRAAYNLWAYGVVETMINANKSPTFRATVQELF
jgi:hypothetical protein